MTTPTLPSLPAERVDAIETAVFGRIADERDRRRRRRRGVWTGVGAAAAVVVVAAIVGPSLGATSGVSGSSTVAGAGDSAPEGGTIDPSAQGFADAEAGPAPVAPDQGGAGARSDASSTTAAAREIVATGSSTVAVDDIAAAIEAIGDAATSAGGYVESSQLGDGGVVMPLEGAATGAMLSSGWITVRVPAASLQRVMDSLGAVGEVTATSVTRSDVTDQAIDLRARVAAGEASVARLTDLMAQAASVSDLIAAESALAERQAQLDSDRQILQSLSSQVAMSTLSVQLTARTASVAADPAGFGDGLTAGWNGLVATLNGVVIGLGFLLPWIVVAVIAATAVWGVRRVARRRRAAREG
ncbi:protein of unknown function [Microbacterium sp. ru370.1]|uniref:DUF4349 domain-containing protein n=1 Tax=unclassified Microbacterium TaxID=2609290 RepID=UPI0008803D14|nr:MULTISPECIES: DUF4349 domain-containing protein [unclassified Microbacterium]SDO81343.1 protein of unknown function [Microbacterium sp. ru370.1]SIT89785.1 protein of unknown function [Microbacterium sp. RU1D]